MTTATRSTRATASSVSFNHPFLSAFPNTDTAADTCAKVVTIEDGYHCPMAKVADQKYCDNHRACAAMNCNEVGSYPDDETKPWYCHLRTSPACSS